MINTYQQSNKIYRIIQMNRTKKYIIYNNFLNPTKTISQESLYWFRQVKISLRILFQETNAN